MSDMNVVGLAADIALSAGFTSIDLAKYGKAFPVIVHVDSRTPFAKRLPKGQSVVRWDVRPKLSLRDPEQLVPFLRTLGEDVSLAPRIDMDLFLFTKRVPKLSSSPSSLKPSSKPPSSSLTEHPGASGGTKSKSSPSLGPVVVLHDDVAIDSHDTVEAIGLREGDQIDLTLDVIAVQKKRKQLEGSSDMQKLGSKSGGGSGGGGFVGNSSFGDRRRRNSSPRTVHQKSPSLSFRGVDGMGSSITSTPPGKVARSPNATNVSFTLPPAIRDVVAESTNSAPSAAVPSYQGGGNSPLRNVLAQNNVKPSAAAAASPPKAAPSLTEGEVDYDADDYGQTPMPYQSMNPNEPLKQAQQQPRQQQPWSGSPYNERDNAGYSRGMPSNGTSHHFLFDELPSSTEQQPNILNASSHDTTTTTGQQQQQQLPQVMELMRMAHHNRRAILDEFYDALDNQDPDHFDFDEDGNPVVLLPNVEEYLMELDNEELELELREISENLQEFVQRQLQVLTDDAASTAALRRPASSSVVDDVRVQNAMDQLIVYVCRRNRLRAAHEEERIFERELLRKKLHSIRTASSRSVSREHPEGVACRRPPGDDKNERFTVTSTGERLDRAYLPSVLEML